MRLKTVITIIVALLILAAAPLFFLFYFQYLSRASWIKSDIHINTKNITSPVVPNWKALAQGGEEMGVRMLQNVIPLVTELRPKYIRLDHIYDFYNVVSKTNGKVEMNWLQLDATVCDILATGAKPFLSLGYMPPAISSDGSLISAPSDWNDWSYVVQQTIEHYSGTGSVLCGQYSGQKLADIYYEVWNEPDLESFGKWSLYGGNKDYKTLYYFSSVGATRVQNTQHFFLGGPATTALYKSWITVFLDYIIKNNLRLDFISWHHYTINPDDFLKDGDSLSQWLLDPKYARYRNVPKIISEWGYDPSPNPISETDGGAAYTIASIRNLINKQLELTFSFEIKDGPNPSWGFMTHEGKTKPRYDALKLLNLLQPNQLALNGEGTYIRAIASRSPEKIAVIMVNYDPEQKHDEQVPVSFENLDEGVYTLTITYTNGLTTTFRTLSPVSGTLKQFILMKPNMVLGLELSKE